MKKGFTLFEVVLSLAVLLIVISIIFPTIGWMISRTKKLQDDTEAGLLMEEGMEASYNVSLSDWAALQKGNVYHPAVSSISGSDAWIMLPNEQSGLEAKFSRRVEVSMVCRSASTGQAGVGPCTGDSVDDVNSKWLTTTVSWDEAGVARHVSSQLMIAKLTTP